MQLGGDVGLGEWGPEFDVGRRVGEGFQLYGRRGSNVKYIADSRFSTDQKSRAEHIHCVSTVGFREDSSYRGILCSLHRLPRCVLRRREMSGIVLSEM